MESWLSKYRVSVPEGTQGNTRIERFEVTKDEAKVHNLRCMFSGNRRTIVSGVYTRLFVDGVLMMSDTPAEVRDHLSAIRKATGHCLITGLGLGMVLQAFLCKREVEHVTVIEKSQDVIDLVAPHYFDLFGCGTEDVLRVVCADALVWKADVGQRFNFVWHDIWSGICTDNADTMGMLHRKYGGRCDRQDSWCRSEVKYQQRQNSRW